MDELIILKHAKEYIDKLAKGVNPLDDSELPDEDIVNNVKICRCLNYVSGVLANDIDCMENGNKKKTKASKAKEPFNITDEQLMQFKYTPRHLELRLITKRINSLIDTKVYKKITQAQIANWLVEAKVLCVVFNDRGHKTKMPTEIGESLDIIVEKIQGNAGEYTALLYGEKAQRYIIDNIDGIVEHIAKPKQAANIGAKWTVEEEQLLVEKFKDGESISTIANFLKRNNGGIRARLKKLGLIEY